MGNEPHREASPIILRYFAMQGRAQPIRHALADAGVAFEDLRVSMADWPKQKGDPSFAGPYGGLPTLTWGDVLVAETLPIAAFVARKLRQYDGLDAAAIAHLEGVCSSCYVEVVLRAGDAIYADMLYPGADVATAFRWILGRMVEKLERLDAIAPEGAWLGGAEPAVADFFAGESVEVTTYLLGPARRDALVARLPRLAALAARVRARPSLGGQWERRPDRFTARPEEDAVVERIRALDLSSLRL
jgi:glutathione S-transferase